MAVPRHVTRRHFMLLLMAGASGDATGQPFVIGDARIRLIVEGDRETGLLHCNLHENERTSVRAARLVAGECGGRIFSLHAQGRRLITFVVDGQRYRFDPNRIFSSVGIDRTLRLYGPSSPRARQSVAALAEWWLRQTGISRAKVVVAMHNNAPGGYSIRSYGRSGELRHEAEAVHENHRHSPDDFFLVTESRFFDHLRAQGMNVVLQASGATDDGSLGVYCARAGIQYVNVEAAFDHLQTQIAMLREIHRMVGKECRPRNVS
jgi:hypothetical protein